MTVTAFEITSAGRLLPLGVRGMLTGKDNTSGGQMARMSAIGAWKLVVAFAAGIVVASLGTALYAQGVSYLIVKAGSVKPLVKGSIGCGIKTGIWLDFDDVLQIEFRNNTYLLNTNSGEGCKV